MIASRSFKLVAPAAVAAAVETAMVMGGHLPLEGAPDVEKYDDDVPACPTPIGDIDDAIVALRKVLAELEAVTGDLVKSPSVPASSQRFISCRWRTARQLLTVSDTTYGEPPRSRPLENMGSNNINAPRTPKGNRVPDQ